MKSVFFGLILVVISIREIQGNESITLYKHRAVNQTLGPDNAIYCQLIDPKGNIVFDSFGRCNLVIERVTMDHNGQWKMSVGLPLRILLEELILTVTVREEEQKPVVITYVAKQQPEVIISCSVSSPYPIRACKFRSPNGQILIAAPGVGQDGYVYHGNEVSIESGLSPHECGLRILNPVTADLGLWRCAMETAYERYYGFLPVLCPWALQSPEVQAIVTTEPTLVSERTSITAQEGDSVTMSCYIQAPIRYCYFRRQNGTIFSVSPGTSTPDMEYVGAGFDSGECGVRFHNLLTTDGGGWSCHVGTYNETQGEQRVSFTVHIEELMSVRHHYNDQGHLAVDVNVSAAGNLEYCRFVRIDGFGLTSSYVPPGYPYVGSLSLKTCSLIIHKATMLNLHPWTVAAKIVGRDEEIVRVTTDNLLWFGPPETPGVVVVRPTFPWTFVLTLVMVGVLLMTLGTILGPKKNRQRTIARVTSFRDSIRNSLRKKPLPPQAPVAPTQVTEQA